jgi:hypothetical protein
MTIIISLASDTVFTNAWNSEPKAISTVQVLERHGFDQSRPARTGLSNHIDMQKPIIVFDTEHAIIVAEIELYDLHPYYGRMVSLVLRARETWGFAEKATTPKIY